MRSVLSKLVIVIISVVLGIGCYSILRNMLKTDYQTILEHDAHLGLAKVQSLSNDILETLKELSQNHISQCSDALLTVMRKHQFNSDYIKDIGFFEQDELVCTTGLGKFETGVEDSTPTYQGIDGAKVWTNKPLLLFNKQISAIIVKLGNYNAVVEQNTVKDLVGHNADWRLTFNQNGIVELVSQSSTYSQNKAHQNGIFISTQQCSDAIPYCIEVIASEQQFEHWHRQTLSVIYIVALLVTVIVFFFIQRIHFKLTSLEARVIRGLKNNAFYCLYQPIVDLESSQIIGCEALARFEDKSGIVYPDQFIPVIKKLDKTWLFTTIIAEKVQQDLLSMELSNQKFKVNINFFAQDISNANVLKIKDIINLAKFPYQLVVEVTEDERLNSELSAKTLSMLIDSGIDIAIDDFGTGYSNLKQIKDIQCHTLKIDRSFIAEMEEGSIRSTLVPHMVGIAQKVGAEIVAEGVENQMQQHALLAVGVKFGQGWHFGKPMPIENLSKLV
jgi:sensor c-di-GMP phosphodiesterase-like protein